MKKRYIAILLLLVLVPVIGYNVNYFVKRSQKRAAASATEPAEPKPADRGRPQPQAGQPANTDSLAALAQKAFGPPNAQALKTVHWSDPFDQKEPDVTSAVSVTEPDDKDDKQNDDVDTPLPPMVALTGILCGERRLAIVDGRIVGVGQQIGPWRIKVIDEDSITLALDEVQHKIILGVTPPPRPED